MEFVGRDGWTAFDPERTDEVDGFELDLRIPLSEVIHAKHLRVDADEALDIGAEPVDDLRAVDIRLAHQFDGRVFEFDAGLEVIAAVGPEERAVFRHYYGSRLAVEAGEPLHLAPVCSHVFTRVRVVTGYNVRRDTRFMHCLPQSGQFLYCLHRI